MKSYRVFFDPNPFGLISIDIEADSFDQLYELISALSFDSFRFDCFIDKVIVK